MTTQITTFQVPTTAGLELAFSAVDAAGNTFVNDGKVLALFQASNVGDLDVLVATPGKYKGETVTSITDSNITQGATEVLGPFPPEIFNSTAGEVTFTYSGTTPASNLTIALVRIP